MDILELRFIERLLIVFIGGMSIYLGYRLFINLPTQQDSSGELKLPGDFRLVLSRVGPGVLFSLFGAAILIVSLVHGLRFDTAPQVAATTKTAEQASLAGFRYASPAADANRLSALRDAARGTVAELDGLSTILAEDVSPSRRNDVNKAIVASKLALMASVWADDWGEFAVFRNWVTGGAIDPPPPGVKPEAIAAFGQIGG